VIRQEDDVASPLAQRRQAEREHGETVIEVLAEVVLADGRQKIAVRRADDPDVGGLAVRAAETPDRTLLDDLQQLGLETLRKQADLVEEDRSAMGGLKEAGLGAPGIGEGAALESEQLGFEERFGDCGTVHVDERLARAGPELVDESGDQALPGAGFPVQQDGGHPPAAVLTSDQSPNALPNRLDRRAFAQQLAQRLHHGARRIRSVSATVVASYQEPGSPMLVSLLPVY
jgi:hypothetical protein